MNALVIVLGVGLILIVLHDAFEAIVLPQTVVRRLRIARTFYVWSWGLWTRLALWTTPPKRRQRFLGVYGPLSVLLLFATWAGSLIFGFAMVQWGMGSRLDLVHGVANFGVDLYMSGTTFFTLGLGDVTPVSTPARVLTAVEAGVGFGFLAIVIAYLPVLYQTFSRRELGISLLDARAGSPPTAEVLLRRLGGDHESLRALLAEWERWAAELMESHLSYPTLAYYRSQHQNQSWLAALTTILDASALTMVSFEGPLARQARLTFAIARHAAVDLAQVFRAPPRPPDADRLTSEGLARMRDSLSQAGVTVRADDRVEAELAELRRFYEPYLEALSQRFLFAIPPWSPHTERKDNWKTSAWADGPGAPGRTPRALEPHEDG